MLDISKTEKSTLENYFDVDKYIKENNLSAFLIKLDDLITSVGFDDDYELTKEGRKLQDIYDSIYLKNKEHVK